MNNKTNQISTKKKSIKQVASIPQSLCVACGVCANVCPKGAITIYRGMYAIVDANNCIGCGMCIKNCPADIISKQEVSK